MNILRHYTNWFSNKLRRKPILKQELLLQLALKEKGFDIKKIELVSDHNLGLNYVNGIKFGIKYPDSFYKKAVNIIPNEKIYNYYFNGNMSESGKRQLLLNPFKSITKSKIIESNEGRVVKNKNRFNSEYFGELARSKFGLCPHQMDWPGDKESMWTYRFIECCFVDSIPVIFKNAPLSSSFIEGFHILWDTAIIDLGEKELPKYDKAMAMHNRELARIKFCFSEIECDEIRKTLN